MKLSPDDQVVLSRLLGSPITEGDALERIIDVVTSLRRELQEQREHDAPFDACGALTEAFSPKTGDSRP